MSAFEFRLNISGAQNSWAYTIPIRPEPVILGRQPGIDVVLDHQQVSRRHAALHCTATECSLVDLGSANGTRLNGQKLTSKVPVTLKSGDSFQIGGFKLEFEQVPLEEVAQSGREQGSSVPQEEVHVVPSEPEVPSPPPPELPLTINKPYSDPSQPPPGLTFESHRLLGYLPPIYHTEFMAKFLAIFEAVLFPVEWQIDSFDLFLDPGTAPASFLPWLANWFDFSFDSTWDDAKKRTFLKEAYSIYSRLGTRWALGRVLEIYCGSKVEIEDDTPDLSPHTFRVKLPRTASIEQQHIERLINAYKPTHTDYILEFIG